MSKTLVLGAAGFIGKSLIKVLSEKHKVVAFDRVEAPEFEGNNNIISVVGDYASVTSFDEYLHDVDTVIHLVSTTVPCDDTAHIPDEIRDNVIPTVKLLEDMHRNGVNKIIFSSSAGAYYGETGDKINETYSLSDPCCSYGVQKAVIESYIRFYGKRYGMDYRIMRISNPYGWGQNPKKMQGLIPIFINKLLRNEPISVYGNGDNKRDYIFMPDLIDAIIKVLDYTGNCSVFNIGYGEYYTINEVISLIEEESGKQFTEISHLNSRFCDVKSSLVDMTESHKILGWKPKTNISDGIRAVYEHYINVL